MQGVYIVHCRGQVVSLEKALVANRGLHIFVLRLGERSFTPFGDVRLMPLFQVHDCNNCCTAMVSHKSVRGVVISQ